MDNLLEIFADAKITVEEAKKRISEMNLINGFLFDSTLENKEDAIIIARNILRAVYNRDFIINDVTSQKSFQAVDSIYHGIRMDAHITEDPDTKQWVATIYDMEMEDRQADKKYLPKRLRYYGALNDVKKLESGGQYDKLPNFVSITILSYDPFDAGDMYYQAKTVLSTHPDIEYNDGLDHIYLYCNGKPNFETNNSPIKLPPEHGKRLQEMLKYIISGQKPSISNADIEEIDKIVTKTKAREEVATAYMRQVDREYSLMREVQEKDNKEAALKIIRVERKRKIPDNEIREDIAEEFGYSDSFIEELFQIIDSQANAVTSDSRY